MAGLNTYQRARERRAFDHVQEAVGILDSIRGELGLEDELETQDLPPGSDERKLVNASNTFTGRSWRRRARERSSRRPRDGAGQGGRPRGRPRFLH
jgi:hypothetical protein